MSNGNVGTIWYVVEAHTQKVIDSLKPTNASIDELSKRFGQSEAAGKKAEFQMTKTAQAIKGMGNESNFASGALSNLTKIAAGLVSLRAAGSIISMADSYQEYADRIQLATKGQEEYNHVQQRLLQNANATERHIEEAQELYLGTADSLRELGYSTSEVVDIGDSLSHSFAANAASGQAAQSAINAFSKAMVRGKVDAMQWISITSAAPTIINDIAKSTGKTTAEIRRMGSEGLISSRQLAEGLRQSREANKDLDESMSMTVSGSMNKITNAMKVYIGEINRAEGGTQLLAKTLTIVAENFDTVATIAITGGAMALGRYISQLGVSTVASMRAGVAARAKASEDLRVAIANEKAAAAALKHALANQKLGGSHAATATAAKTHAAAATTLAAAQSSVVSVGRSLLGVLGGPVGIVAMLGSAAAAMLLLRDNSMKAKSEIDFLTVSIHDLGDANLRLTKTKLIDKIDEMKGLGGEAKKAGARIEYLKSQLDQFPNSKMAREWESELISLDATVESANEELASHAEILKSIEELEKEREKNKATGKGARDPEAEKRLKDMRDELELVKLTGEARARLKAIQKLGDNATEEQKKEAGELAAKIYQLEEAHKKAKEASKKGLKESEQAAKENAKALADMSEELRQATMEGKSLAQAKALAKLNKFATEKDIARVKILADALYELELAEENRQKLASADPLQAERQKHEEQLGMLKTLNDAKLMEDQRYFDLKGQMEREHTLSMQRLEEENFAKQSWANEMVIKGLNNFEQAAGAAFTNLATGAANSTESIQALAAGISQELISSLVKMGMTQVKAWAMGQMAQKAAAAGYAASVSGQVEATTALAAQAAFASTAAIPIIGPEAAPAAAAAAGAAAQALGTPAIAASALVQGGGRLYGGPVGPNSMHRINEDGKPEILNTANGQQYLLPNSRGQVVSNKDAKGGGQVNVSVVINSDGSMGVNTDQTGWMKDGEKIGRMVQSIVDERMQRAMQPGGTIRSGFYG